VYPIEHATNIQLNNSEDPLVLSNCSDASMLTDSGKTLKKEVLGANIKPCCSQQDLNKNSKINRKYNEKWIVMKSPHKTVESFKCEYCGKAFDKSEAVDFHTRFAHNIVKDSLKIFTKRKKGKEEGGQFHCKQCGKTYARNSSLEIHTKRAHNVNSTYPCPENCGKLLTGKGRIKKHLLSHRPESEWPVGCPLCSKRFQAKSDLNLHLLGSKHKKDNLPEVGTDQWWALVYWDRPKDAPKKK